MTRFYRNAAVMLVLAATAVVIGCGTKVDEFTTTNIHGLDIRNFDTTAVVCDDFYQYANGGWMANNPVPAEYSSWTTAHEVFERNNVILKDILDEVGESSHEAGTVAQKIGDFFASGMDTATVNATGIGPLQADFDRIAAVSSVAELGTLISEFHLEGMGVIFDSDVLEDLMNSSMVNLYATQGGLGLPEKGYYTRDDEEAKTLRAQYVEHIGNMFTLLGDTPEVATANAEKVMVLESRLADASWNDTEMRNYPAWYRVKSVDEFQTLTPNFDWNNFLGTLGLSDVDSISMGPEQFFTDLNEALTEVPLEDWKQYLRWNLVSGFAFFAGEEFDAENFRFYGTILGGSQERRERHKRVTGTINGALGEAVGQLYVERAFPPESKTRALEMVNNLKTVLRDRLSKLEWMTDETKTKALTKLDAFKQKIGYPDKWRDYSGLEIKPGAFMENARAASRFHTQYNLAKVGKAPDPTEWEMSPQTVNAYYHPLKNEIVFPAGILQPPYFDGEIDDAINYGAMGAIIGHEMLHGFDDSGSRFDADGNMINWWTDEDRARFEEYTAKLIKQFGDYVAIDSLHVNGELTLGENIADLGGLRVSYAALQIAREGKEDPMIDGFTQNQRFFLSFAQNWRGNYTPEALKLQVQTDPHTPNRFRAIGPVSNLDEFAEAFDCSDDSPMMRPVEERIRIW